MLALRIPPRPNFATRNAAGPQVGQRGLTRAESLWILGLSAFILAIIFWSWRSDLSQARERLAGQQMAFMVGQVRFAMETATDDIGQWPPLMVGPGEQPNALSELNPASLNQVLPEYTYMPSDPWQRAFALQKQADGTWLVACLGADGVWPSDLTALALHQRVYPPQ